MKKNFYTGQILLLFLLLIFFVNFAEAAQTVQIKIPETIYSNRSSFKLGQIANITGGNKQIRRILANIDIYPDNGAIERADVLRAINNSDAADARIELYMPVLSRIEAPDYEGNFTETESQAPSRSPSELVPLIKSLAAWHGGLEISTNNAPVPDGRLIDPASIVPGSSSAVLRFQDRNGKIKSLPVRMIWTQNAMIAARNIKRGDRIDYQDLYSRPVRITRPGVYASSPEEIVGFTANKNIQQGEPVLLSNVTSSNLIKRGRRVKIFARSAGTTASIDGILLEDGRPGDWVKVRRADNKRITLRAKILNENLVEVPVE